MQDPQLRDSDRPVRPCERAGHRRGQHGAPGDQRRRPDVVGVTAMTRSAVELGHQLTVCGAGGFEAFVPFREFAAEVENLLFRLGGAACERLDVGRGAEAGGFPSCLSQGLGRRRSSRVMCADSRPLRAVRFATSASSDLRPTCVPAVVPGGGWPARAMTAASGRPAAGQGPPRHWRGRPARAVRRPGAGPWRSSEGGFPRRGPGPASPGRRRSRRAGTARTSAPYRASCRG